jgi:hypothetical protein
MMSYLPIILMQLLAVVLTPVVLAMSSPPQPDEPVLVVALVGALGLDEIIANAGGEILGPEQAPLATLAYSSDPDFINQLHLNGAWLVLDGRRIAAICGVSS